MLIAGQGHERCESEIAQHQPFELAVSGVQIDGEMDDHHGAEEAQQQSRSHHLHVVDPYGAVDGRDVRAQDQRPQARDPDVAGGRGRQPSGQTEMPPFLITGGREQMAGAVGFPPAGSVRVGHEELERAVQIPTWVENPVSGQSVPVRGKFPDGEPEPQGRLPEPEVEAAARRRAEPRISFRRGRLIHGKLPARVLQIFHVGPQVVLVALPAQHAYADGKSTGTPQLHEQQARNQDEKRPARSTGLERRGRTATHDVPPAGPGAPT
ncbi:hypothetical protein DSECCO2_348230 [anaerobic digester metagenome]